MIKQLIETTFVMFQLLSCNRHSMGYFSQHSVVLCDLLYRLLWGDQAPEAATSIFRVRKK